ncbi:MAG: hypothetical protein Q9170_005331 [Blastenia crenularia]
MRHHILSHGHALRNFAQSALNEGRGGIRHVYAPERCSCFRKQKSKKSTFPARSQEKIPVCPRTSKLIVQTNTSIPSAATEVPAFLGKELLSKANTVLQSSTIPDTAAVEESLQACQTFSRIVAEEAQTSGQDLEHTKSPASNLLSLDESQDGLRFKVQQDVPLTGEAKSAAAELISSIAYKIITDPKVYITPKLLSVYVNIQSLLGRPRSLPEVFHMYASKPIAKSKKGGIKYTNPSPNKPSAHIPLEIADRGLTAAIKIKDLSLCFDIIEYSVCARAFRVSKFFRKAFVPILGAVLAPFAIHRLAAQLSTYQSTTDSKMATQMIFAGIMAYVGFTSIIGVVAITTANDQMDRVTWVVGTPLRERWMREEERMLIDRVAGAWGFQQRSRRGEEEGPDWEALRELIGMRGMVLDKTSLMDGMQ